MRHLLVCVLCLCALAFSCFKARAEEQMPVSEVARTPEGNFTIFHRTPASTADLEMPIPKQCTMGVSTVYRVQDRKGRNLLYLARAELTTAQSAASIIAFYQHALRKDAEQERETKTGTVTLTDGEKDHFRLVAITPKGAGCTFRLEHVQHFTIPPRVYTKSEQQVIDLLHAVAANYATAQQVSYEMEQRVIMSVKDKTEKAPPTLHWKTVFTRPGQLHVTAGADEVVALEISTEGESLKVHRQVGGDETREFVGSITLDDLPEMQDDPVAGLMFGETLVNRLLDTLSMRAIKGTPAGEQTEVILTYPDTNETLHLIIDLRKKIILRSETIITDDTESVTNVRTYTNTTVTPPVAAGKNAAPPQPTPKSRASAAVTGL